MNEAYTESHFWGKYLFKINHNEARALFVVLLLVSLLFTLSRQLPAG